MVEQGIQISKVAHNETGKIIAVQTLEGKEYTTEQIRDFIDKGTAVVAVSPDGNATTVTKRDETMIQAVRDDTKENNLESLPEFTPA